MSNPAVANEIRSQLGGRMFEMMTGARGFVYSDNGVQFNLGSGANKKITKVVIKLNGKDLYDVEFGKIFKYEYVKVAERHDIDVENLREVFTEITGFSTRI